MADDEPDQDRVKSPIRVSFAVETFVDGDYEDDYNDEDEELFDSTNVTDDLTYGTIDPSSSTNNNVECLEESGDDKEPVVPEQQRPSILRKNRRSQMQEFRSIGSSSVRRIRNSLGGPRRGSVMSIYSPLEARRVDGGLSPRSLTCIVMNLISAGYILLPHGTL